MRKREGKLTKEQAERVQDYVEVFSTPAGKRVLEDLDIEFGGECHVKGDPHESQYRSNLRDLIMRIKYMLSLGGMDVESGEE